MAPNDKVEEHAQRAEHYAPAHIHRLVHHYHNLIYAKNYWETIGQQCPQWVNEELIRCDGEIKELLSQEKESGGALHRGEPSKQRRY